MTYIERTYDPHSDTIKAWENATSVKKREGKGFDHGGEGVEPLYEITTPDGVFIERIGCWDHGSGLCIRVCPVVEEVTTVTGTA